jgi:hypothetical protein
VAEKRCLIPTKRSTTNKKQKAQVLSALKPLNLTAHANGQKAKTTMTFYNKFDTQIQCEERNEVTPEEYAEVMMLMATEEPEDFEGYSEWSKTLEQEPEKDWLNGYSNSTDGPSYEGIDI